MIYILHGEDSNSSRAQLISILSKYPLHQKIYITQAETQNLFAALHSQSFFAQKQIIICENVLSNKKEFLQEVLGSASGKPVIFWENKRLTFKLPPSAKDLSVSEFKPPSTLYFFLDSLQPNSAVFAKHLKSAAENQPILNWHMANRVLLLILAKKGYSRQTAAKITQKSLQDWQWNKLVQQAAKFSEKSLLKLFNAILKLDYLKKTGQTNADSTSIITLLLLKHLEGANNVTINFSSTKAGV